MKYTSDYLTKQLDEAGKISGELSAKLESDPNNFALFLCARSMEEHVAEIRQDLENTQKKDTVILSPRRVLTEKGVPAYA